MCFQERLDEYKRLFTIGKVFGIESHVLGPEETKKLYPLMNVDDIYGTLYSPGMILKAYWTQNKTNISTCDFINKNHRCFHMYYDGLRHKRQYKQV